MITAFIGLATILTSVLISACGDDEEKPGHSQRKSTFQKVKRGIQSNLQPQYLPARPCPGEMVRVERFCVDRYENHLKVGGKIHPHQHRPPSESSYVAASASGVFPQAYLNREEAALACKNAGKRLCSLAEWLRACRGPRSLVYSYGNLEEKGRCNKGKPHLMLQMFKDEDPIRWGYETHFNNPILNETPGFLAKTGEHSGCVSEYGSYDMVGNLHEWVADEVDLTLPTKIHLNPRLEEKYRGLLGFGIFMGGFYSTTSEHGSGCGFITLGHEPSYHDYSTGFRCCKDAKTE